MGFNLSMLNRNGEIDRLLSTFSYPVDKDEIITKAHVVGVNQQAISVMERVLSDDEVFASSEEVQQALRVRQAD